MAEQEREDKTKVFDKLTGTQKSAILMMLLGEDEASEILKNLTPKEVQHLGSAMYSVEGLDQDTVNKVLDEFLAIIKEQTSLGLGAGNYIQNVLNKALGQDRAQSILGRIFNFGEVEFTGTGGMYIRFIFVKDPTKVKRNFKH